MEVVSKEWYISAYAPSELPTSHHLKLRSVTISLEPDERHVAVQNLWISVDPFLRARMTGRDDGLYAPQYKLDEVITAYGIGKVMRSKESNYKEGDIIINPFSPIAEYYIIPVDSPMIIKIDPSLGIPLPEYVSSLGMAGFAAWVGIVVLGEAKEGSNVFISAAAGGVGMVAGQLAKLKGCRVIGSTGSDDKVKLLKDELEFDDAFNYHKETDFDAALSKYFPNGIDLYLDNVGGRMLEAVVNHINHRARIPLCGMISGYNKIWTEREGVRNLLNLVGKEVRMEGYMIGSYLDYFGDFTKEMAGYLMEGKLKSKLTIQDGIECFLESLTSLFSSSNSGKVVIKVN